MITDVSGIPLFLLALLTPIAEHHARKRINSLQVDGHLARRHDAIGLSFNARSNHFGIACSAQKSRVTIPRIQIRSSVRMEIDRSKLPAHDEYPCSVRRPQLWRLHATDVVPCMLPSMDVFHVSSLHLRSRAISEDKYIIGTASTPDVTCVHNACMAQHKCSHVARDHLHSLRSAIPVKSSALPALNAR